MPITPLDHNVARDIAAGYATLDTLAHVQRNAWREAPAGSGVPHPSWGRVSAEHARLHRQWALAAYAAGNEEMGRAHEAAAKGNDENAKIGRYDWS